MELRFALLYPDLRAGIDVSVHFFFFAVLGGATCFALSANAFKSAASSFAALASSNRFCCS
jgi:hypothetical protein